LTRPPTSTGALLATVLLAGLAAAPACSSVPPARPDARIDGSVGGSDATDGGDDGAARPADGQADADAGKPRPDLGQPCDPGGGDGGAGGGADGGDGRCPAGTRCCTACCKPGEVARCVTPDDDGECPLPDLMVDEAKLKENLVVASKYFAPESCALVEGCVAQPGQRRILRFSTGTPNIGTADMVLGAPDTSSGNFVYSACHDHYHFVHYAQYRLLDMQGREVGTGRKQAFCLLDAEKYRDDAPEPGQRFTCTNQGIHMGWADVYGAGLDCQWLDVTDLPDGDYQLEVHLNPERVLQEKSYDNNITTVPVRIEGGNQPVEPTEACPPVSGYRGETRECSWTVSLQAECEVRTKVSVGCNAALGCGLGSCEGNTVLRVCAGDEACTLGLALASNDDACGKPDVPNRCSFTTFNCPANGRYTVMTGAFDPSQEATCNLEVR
jgi:hypothetical protein